MLNLADEKFERRFRDFLERGWRFFACPDTDSFFARYKNQEGRSPLAIHIDAFGRVLVVLVSWLFATVRVDLAPYLDQRRSS
jgi:hypothetical protein